MFSQNQQISLRQMKRMMTIEIFSTTSLLLPALLVRTSDYDGLLPLLLGSALALLYTRYLVGILNYTRQDFISYAQRSIGKVGVMILAGIYFLRFVIRGGFALELFSRLVLETLLPDHQLWTITIPMLLLCGYVAIKGVEVRGRTLELLFFLIFVPLILVLLLALPKVELEQVIPRMQLNYGHLFENGYLVLLCYSAVEFLLFLTPHVTDRKEIKKGAISACSVVIILNLAIFVVTLGMFGVQASKKSLWPALSIMQSVRMPGGFIERLDILLIAFWIFSMFGIISAYLFYASYFARRAIYPAKSLFFVMTFLILVYLLTAMVQDMETAFQWYMRYMALIDFPIGFLAPILLVIIGKCRKVES